DDQGRHHQGIPMKAPFAVWTAFVLTALIASAGFVFLDHLGETAAESNVRIGLHEQGLDDPLLRQRAAEACAIAGPGIREAVPVLIAALKDPDPGMRIAAARSLGQIGPDARAALPALT